MIFSELYSAYYNAVAAVLSAVLAGERSEKELQKIVALHAFDESILTILPSLQSEKWQLIHADMTTPLSHTPSMPLSTLQKQWLKAISLDPRIKLFDVDFPALENVAPLFTPKDFVVYDKYGDGDDFESPEYVRQFRVILSAIHQKSQIKFEMTNRKGNTVFVRCRPVRLEYSEKDDKFRVITAGWRTVKTVNLAKIRHCAHYLGTRRVEGEEAPAVQETLTVRLTDERNALERFLLHFAHFEKQAEQIDETHYLIKIKYASEDETELVIRILSFGPLVEALSPPSFREAVIERLKQQMRCRLK